MIVVERQDISIAQIFPADQPDRSPGLHLSSIILSIMQEIEPDKYGGGDPMQAVCVLAGIAMERALERSMAQMHQTQFPSIIRPGEFMLEGIAGTPDGLGCADDPPRLYEYKWTQKSARAPLTDKRFFAWMLQIKCYLKMMRLRAATLIALFANGAYERGQNGGTPLLKGFDLTFGEQEIQEAWWLVVNHARRKGML